MFTADNSTIYPDCSTDETELTISKNVTEKEVTTDQGVITETTAVYYLTYSPIYPWELEPGNLTFAVRCYSPTYTFIGWDI